MCDAKPDEGYTIKLNSSTVNMIEKIGDDCDGPHLKEDDSGKVTYRGSTKKCRLKLTTGSSVGDVAIGVLTGGGSTLVQNATGSTSPGHMKFTISFIQKRKVRNTRTEEEIIPLNWGNSVTRPWKIGTWQVILESFDRRRRECIASQDWDCLRVTNLGHGLSIEATRPVNLNGI